VFRLPEYLDTAIVAAKKAGKVLMKYYNKKNVSNHRKKDNSFVTEADVAAEKIILDTILKKFPSHAFHSEEKGVSKNHSEYCWYIDPLDGTHNFMHKIPLFSTSIALAKNGKFIVGVVYLPYLDELFYAKKGKGAFMNGKKIHVSDNTLKNSIFSPPTAIVYHGTKIAKLIELFTPKVSDIRMIGSAAISLSYIACGRFDFSIKTSITPYDIGAGKVIIEEAGGKVTQLDNRDFTGSSDNSIASNGLFHKELIKIMREEWKE